MPKFTPGPWHFGIGKAEEIIYNQKGWAVANATVLHGRADAEECKANARLIAAAPEMYAALRKAERLAWEVGCETVDGVNTILEDERGDLWREISAILAKIEG